MKRIVGAGCIMLMLTAEIASGAGFQLYTEGSSEALGQAAAISGRDDLASLAWYNPAALAGADQTLLQAGAVFLQIRTDFNSDLSPSLNSSMSDDWRTIPHLYYVKPVSSELTASLSVNAPYGLITEWPQDWAGNLAAAYSEFSAIYVTPSLAYRVHDRLALAAGFNVVVADAELSASRDFSAIGGPNFGLRTVEGDDVGYGYTASMHSRFSEHWAVGARYQSRVKVKLEGDVDFDSVKVAQGSALLELPSSFNAGIVNNTLERLQLGLDVIWTEWSTYEQLVYNFGPGYPVTSVTPNPEVNPKRWDDVWSIRLGAEYDLLEGWVCRAGYAWDQSPVNDATRAPELPGSNRQMLTAGLGWRWERLTLDLAYAYLWAENSRTGSEVVATVPTLAGRYDTVTHIVGLSAGYVY